MIFKHGIKFVKVFKPRKGYEICPKCKGIGSIAGISVDDFAEEDCELCGGKGEIDWITYMRCKGSGLNKTS